MNPLTKSTLLPLVLVCIAFTGSGQQKKVLVDVGHGQKFYSDPADNISTSLVPADRLKYMTGELSKNAATHGATVGYVKVLTKKALAAGNVLFIHTPSTKYALEEVAAIQKFIEKGGSLFIVLEVDYWARLDQTNANDILKPYGIAFKGDNPDEAAVGGHSTAGALTKTRYKIPSHGARMVEGGTPFAVSDKTETEPLGVYKETPGGGKVVAMGEGMVSLYMTSWQGVSDYQCSGFMEEVMGWLLR